MKLSDGVEWGIHCAALLAVLPPGAVLPGKALAEYHGISESYLVKHLQALTAAGLLGAGHGPRGGYRLARPAQSGMSKAAPQTMSGLVARRSMRPA
jgi:DNA-binding IscR family transcriptional regulator